MPRTRKSLEHSDVSADAGAPMEISVVRRSGSNIRPMDEVMETAPENSIPRASKRKLSLGSDKRSPLTLMAEMGAQGSLVTPDLHTTTVSLDSSKLIRAVGPNTDAHAKRGARNLSDTSPIAPNPSLQNVSRSIGAFDAQRGSANQALPLKEANSRRAMSKKSSHSSSLDLTKQALRRSMSRNASDKETPITLMQKLTRLGKQGGDLKTPNLHTTDRSIDSSLDISSLLPSHEPARAEKSALNDSVLKAYKKSRSKDGRVGSIGGTRLHEVGGSQGSRSSHNLPASQSSGQSSNSLRVSQSDSMVFVSPTNEVTPKKRFRYKRLHKGKVNEEFKRGVMARGQEAGRGDKPGDREAGRNDEEEEIPSFENLAENTEDNRGMDDATESFARLEKSNFRSTRGKVSDKALTSTSTGNEIYHKDISSSNKSRNKEQTTSQRSSAAAKSPLDLHQANQTLSDLSLTNLGIREHLGPGIPAKTRRKSNDKSVAEANVANSSESALLDSPLASSSAQGKRQSAARGREDSSKMSGDDLVLPEHSEEQLCEMNSSDQKSTRRSSERLSARRIRTETDVYDEAAMVYSKKRTPTNSRVREPSGNNGISPTVRMSMNEAGGNVNEFINDDEEQQENVEGTRKPDKLKNRTLSRVRQSLVAEVSETDVADSRQEHSADIIPKLKRVSVHISLPSGVESSVTEPLLEDTENSKQYASGGTAAQPSSAEQASRRDQVVVFSMVENNETNLDEQRSDPGERSLSARKQSDGTKSQYSDKSEGSGNVIQETSRRLERSLQRSSDIVESSAQEASKSLRHSIQRSNERFEDSAHESGKRSERSISRSGDKLESSALGTSRRSERSIPRSSDKLESSAQETSKRLECSNSRSNEILDNSTQAKQLERSIPKSSEIFENSAQETCKRLEHSIPGSSEKLETSTRRSTGNLRNSINGTCHKLQEHNSSNSEKLHQTTSQAVALNSQSVETNSQDIFSKPQPECVDQPDVVRVSRSAAARRSSHVVTVNSADGNSSHDLQGTALAATQSQSIHERSGSGGSEAQSLALSDKGRRRSLRLSDLDHSGTVSEELKTAEKFLSGGNQTSASNSNLGSAANGRIGTGHGQSSSLQKKQRGRSRIESESLNPEQEIVENGIDSENRGREQKTRLSRDGAVGANNSNRKSVDDALHSSKKVNSRETRDVLMNEIEFADDDGRTDANYENSIGRNVGRSDIDKEVVEENNLREESRKENVEEISKSSSKSSRVSSKDRAEDKDTNLRRSRGANLSKSVQSEVQRRIVSTHDHKSSRDTEEAENEDEEEIRSAGKGGDVESDDEAIRDTPQRSRRPSMAQSRSQRRSIDGNLSKSANSLKQYHVGAQGKPRSTGQLENENENESVEKGSGTKGVVETSKRRDDSNYQSGDRMKDGDLTRSESMHSSERSGAKSRGSANMGEKSNNSAKSGEKSAESSKSGEKPGESSKSDEKSCNSKKSGAKASSSANSRAESNDSKKGDAKSNDDAKRSEKSDNNYKHGNKSSDRGKSDAKASNGAKSSVRSSESEKSGAKSSDREINVNVRGQNKDIENEDIDSEAEEDEGEEESGDEIDQEVESDDVDADDQDLNDDEEDVEQEDREEPQEGSSGHRARKPNYMHLAHTPVLLAKPPTPRSVTIHRGVKGKEPSRLAAGVAGKAWGGDATRRRSRGGATVTGGRVTKEKQRACVPRKMTRDTLQFFTGMKLSKEALEEVEDAAEEYWTGLVEDLDFIRTETGRKVVERAHVELLMRRQGLITDTQPVELLIERYLPLEYRQELIPVARAGNRIELKKFEH